MDADKRVADANNTRQLADQLMESMRDRISDDLMSRTFLLIEMQRVLDARTVALDRTEKARDVHHHYMLKWGMNLATAELLAVMPCSGIPLVTSTPELKIAAEGLLWEFGLVSLLRRCSEMILAGQMDVCPGELSGDLVFAGNRTVHFEFLDRLEEGALKAFEAEFTAEDSPSLGWTIVSSDIGDKALKETGAFWRKPAEKRKPRESWAEIASVMENLFRPWPSPHGVLVAYDADPRVDDYYMTVASLALEQTLVEGGIHPSTKFDGFSGLDLVKVLMSVIAIYKKHEDFCVLAKKKHSEIAIADSLTLWAPRQGLLHSIAEHLDLAVDLVDRVLRCLSVSSADSDRIASELTPVLPFLLDLGNGMVLRPLSSLNTNPFVTFKIISQWRNRNTFNQISKHREQWLRNDLFSIFGGRRYRCVERGVVIKRGKEVLTDIDAAIFDRTTGELALFQLKWQDYGTEDARKRSSRARNFAADVDTWADSVGTWLSEQGPMGVAQAMRLNVRNGELPTAVYMFVLSRSVARTQAYGHPVQSSWLSVATWPQFRRLRGGLGPAPLVFSKLHELLREEEQKSLAGYKSLDYTVCLSDGKALKFTGLWYGPDE